MNKRGIRDSASKSCNLLVKSHRSIRDSASKSCNLLVKSHRSQVTLFIIIAIVLVAVIVLIFNVQIRNAVENIVSVKSPVVRLQECITPDLKQAVQEISMNGGSSEPINYFASKGEKIEYLCFTNQYYQTCSIQQPLLRQHMEREILGKIQGKVESCVSSIKENLRASGYNVQDDNQKISLEITNEKINVLVSGLSASKEDTGVRYGNFVSSLNSNLYNLIMITTSILNFEARYGDSESTLYMIYYPGVKVEKLKQSDGSKIYILTEDNDKFRFATRSLSWPGGYGSGEIFTPIRI